MIIEHVAKERAGRCYKRAEHCYDRVGRCYKWAGRYFEGRSIATVTVAI